MANILHQAYKDVFLPSVYDALLLIRTPCDFRDVLLFISLQAVIVPVGRIGLGRILNVVGSIIDPYS